MKITTLNKNYDFQRVYKKGKSYVTPSFVIYIRKNNKQGIRLGFTVSKKIGNAVIRNRSKRRLREIFRASFNPKLTELDVVVVARSRSKNENFSKMIQDMSNIFMGIE